jgi:ATP-dependent Clp protease ATP-binding subunit ClpA
MMVLVLVPQAFAEEPILIKWPDSPVQFQINFSQVTAGISVRDTTNPKQVHIKKGFPAVVPYATENPRNYPRTKVLNVSSSNPSQVAVIGANIVYMDRHGVSFLFPAPIGGNPHFAWTSGKDVSVIQYTNAHGALSSYAFTGHGLIELPELSAPIQLQEAKMNGESLIINGESISLHGKKPVAVEMRVGVNETTSIEHARGRPAPVAKAHADTAAPAPQNAQGAADSEGSENEKAAEFSARTQAEVEYAKSQGRHHPGQLGVTVKNNDDEVVDAWQIVQEFAEDLRFKYRGETYVNDPDLREVEDKILTSLLNREIPSVALLAEAGTGKTTLLRNLCARFNAGDVPERLKSYTLLGFTPSAMDTGSKWAGATATKMNALLNLSAAAFNGNKGQFVAVIDEAHQLKGIGAAGEKSSDITQDMTPPLVDGTLRALAITTPHEWSMAFAQDPAFDSRFNRVRIEEPAGEKLIKMVIGWAKRHKLELSHETAAQIVRLSNRFDAVGAQPRKSVKLMEDLFSMLEFEGKKGTPAIADANRAAVKKYGIDPALLDPSKMKSRLDALNKDLDENLIGQDRARSAVIESERLIVTETHDASKPQHLNVYAGPSGQGKTELSGIVARATLRPDVRISMSEFSGKGDVEKFRNRVGQALLKNGAVSLFFDKIEQAHPEVQAAIAQIIETGRFIAEMGGDSSGKNKTIITISTRNAAISLATTAGSAYIDSLSSQTDYNEEKMRNAMMRDGVSEDLLENLNVVPFFYLNKDEFKKLVRLNVEKILKSFREGTSETVVEIESKDAFVDGIVKTHFKEKMNGRTALRILKDTLRSEVSRAVYEAKGKRHVNLGYDSQKNALHVKACAAALKAD